jgi:hypothetical protein
VIILSIQKLHYKDIFFFKNSMATSGSNSFKEYNIVNFVNYPDELKMYVPYSVIGYLSFYEGLYKLEEQKQDGTFRLIIKEKPSVPVVTNQKPEVTYKKENVILGKIDTQTGKLIGPYYIVKEKDLLNMMMDGTSRLSAGLTPDQVKKGPFYLDKQTGQWKESGNYKVFFSFPNHLIVDQYQNFKLTIQTEQYSYEEFKYKTTRHFTNGVLFYSATYDVYDTPVEYMRTYNVSPNPSFSTSFQDSTPDNNVNSAVRQFFALSQPTPDVSLWSSKVHPLINEFFVGNDNSELVITYTETGVAYSLHLINSQFGSLVLIDQGLVSSDLVDLMLEIQGSSSSSNVASNNSSAAGL